ncbi:MAG: lysophospholipid acyltransferase family protein [Bacteroidales bacterium]|nr:lysophospholipid acyltransferase family protein [Bacteroidales bacterium]
MLSKLLFYLVLLPLAYLPIRVLYALSTFIFFLLYKVFGYRKKVVFNNLRNSFPEKGDEEIAVLAKKYYRHLADIAVELVLNMRLSPKKLFARYRVTNPQMTTKYFEQGKSVILMSAHYNNWEYMITSLEHQLLHHGVGVGKQLSNVPLDKCLNKRRTRYGTEVVFADTVRQTFEYYEHHHVPTAYMMLCDQSPNDIHKCWRTTFLNQDTGVIYGAEYFAKKYDIPVLYYEVNKVKRGFYEVTFRHITDTPNDTQHGEIVEKYVRMLEQTIKQQPEYWLWSHRRWKHKRPSENV